MLPEVIPKGKALKEAKAKDENYSANLTSFIYMNTTFGERKWYVRECIKEFGVKVNGSIIKDPYYEVKVGDTIKIKWDEFSFYDVTTSELIIKCWR